jgi:putative phosphoesterase
MKIGIIADTHDNLPAIDKAVRRLNQERVQLVLHLGDYVAGFAVLHFKPLEAKLIGVFGNNDGDHQLLEKRFKEINAEIHGSFADVRAEGVKIAMTHGDELELLNSLIATESYDVVAYGHSHEAGIERKGKTLVINPGEICGYLSGKSTIALLDTQTLSATIVEI